MNITQLVDNFKSGLVVPDGDAVAERYVLDELIRRGGYGAVFRGHRVSDASQEYALKFYFQTGIRGQEGESRVLARLQSHPGVVKVHGRFSGRNLDFLVMELAKKSLYDDIADRRKVQGALAHYTVPEILDIGRQIAQTLQYVHDAAGLAFHGDINPKNVLLFSGRYLGAGKFDTLYKLADFGLALSKDSITALEKRHSLTSTGKQRGTSGYIAPEWRDPQLKKDGRVDVYAFGVLLQELLIGRSIEDQNDHDKHVLRPAELGIAVPAALEKVIYNCFAGDREQRPKNFSEVLTILESITPGSLVLEELAARIKSPVYTVKQLQDLQVLLHRGECSFTDKECDKAYALLGSVGKGLVTSVEKVLDGYLQELDGKVPEPKRRDDILVDVKSIKEVAATFRLLFPKLVANKELKSLYEV